MVPKVKPKLAVWKFASCDGCQLSLLDCEDELLEIAEVVEIANFLEASSNVLRGPYDISLVEGSIITLHDADRIQQVRHATRMLITIGACATAGGIQALRNFSDVKEYVRQVYPSPAFINTLERSTPISQHVKVDYELHGCPVNKKQLVEVLNAFIHNRKPNIHPFSVCEECKARSTTCVMVAQGISCLGPVTHSGCGALCPAYGRGCYGCFGPKETPNTASLAKQMALLGMPDAEIGQVFRSFNAYSEAFRKESEAHEHQNH
jgi:coenzyme F420-reducing hydrogenase gamma subunit